MKKFVFLLSVLAAISCRKTETPEPFQTFDSAKWKSLTGWDNPYRERLLPVLTDTDTLKKLDRKQILELLGPPDYSAERYLYYQISRQHFGPMPILKRTMVLKLTEKDSLEWIRIHE